MKQNKDREEFMARYEGANTVQSSISSFMANDIWQWIETHTKKKVEEALQPIKTIISNNYDEQFGTFDVDEIGSDILKIDCLEEYYKTLTVEPKELSNSNKQLKTRINKKLIPVVKTMQTKPNLCKSKDLKCENCKWFTDNRSDHCNFCLNKNEFKSKDKLGDDFSKFLEDEGYTVIDIK